MRLAVALIACGVGLLAQAPTPPQAPPTGSATLKARVVAADSGVPARRASVRVESNDFAWAATTDDDGRFVVPDLPAGRYTIRVSRPGFVTWLFGREPGGSRSRVDPLELQERQTLDRGDLRLPRNGVIAGRIVDEFGDPVANTDVRALRLNYLVPGEGRLDYVKHATTNDLGEYRIFDLPPGRYFVAIGLSVQEAMERTAQSTTTTRIVAVRSGVAPQFYPGTAVATDATPLDVGAGSVINGIDIRQQSVSLAAVSGTITNSRGQPASGVIVMLQPARADAVLHSMGAMVEPDRDGRFHLVNIPPGDYRVDVVSKARLEAIGQSGSSSARPAGVIEEIASVPVTVAGRDIDGLEVRTGRAFTLGGRIQIEGTTGLPAGHTISVHANPAMYRQGMSGMFLGGAGTVQPDGRFAVLGVASRLIVRVSGIPDAWALKRVTLDGVDVTDAGVDVQTDLTTVEVILTARPTKVIGTVVDATGAAVRDYAAIVVFSTDNQRWTLRQTRYVKSERPNSGAVTITGLPAGDYLAAAVDILERDWTSPIQLEELKRSATMFTLADGEVKTLTVVRKY